MASVARYPMSAGYYIASVTSKDERGGKVTVQRNFTIAKSGEQVLGVATGEPTLVPTATIVPTVVPTSSQTTVTPTVALSITPSPTLTVSITPTTSMTYPTVQPSPQTPPLWWKFLYAYFCKFFPHYYRRWSHACFLKSILLT